MNDCIDAEVRDALPDLIHGRLSDLDTATLNAHVETCANCRAEVELLRQLRAAAPFAPHIDVARIVSALPARMPSAADYIAPSRTSGASSSRQSFIWKTATAAGLLIVGSLTFANARHQSVSIATPKAAISAVAIVAPQSPAVQSPAAESSEKIATPQVAETVPVKVARTASSAGLSLAGGVQDLTDDQLQTLVNDLDKVQGLPSAEPEAVSIGVDDNEGIQ
jgi:anti-sigma factor RsiW